MGGVNQERYRPAVAPAWLGDERLERVVWNRLADPGDSEARDALGAHGLKDALGGILWGSKDPELVKLAYRWAARLAQVNPHRDLHNASLIGARCVFPGDEEWPEPVNDLGAQAPLCLWMKGPAKPDWAETIAVVGSRTATPYGVQMGTELGFGLAERGLCVVSGGAFGIDAAAHRGALAASRHHDASAGEPPRVATVAVLAGGLDRLYPKGNEQLLRHIGQHQLLISEAPCGVPHARWRFLERNRIIAALGAATVVVEAAHKSGALNTVRWAGEILHRSVGAVPGPVTSAQSVGCHQRLRDGATLITAAVEAYALVKPFSEEANRHEQLSLVAGVDDPVALRVFDALPRTRGHSLDSLARHTAIPTRQVLEALGSLRAQGRAVQDDCGWRRAQGH